MAVFKNEGKNIQLKKYNNESVDSLMLEYEKNTLKIKSLESLNEVFLEFASEVENQIENPGDAKQIEIIKENFEDNIRNKVAKGIVEKECKEIESIADSFYKLMESDDDASNKIFAKKKLQLSVTKYFENVSAVKNIEKAVMLEKILDRSMPKDDSKSVDGQKISKVMAWMPKVVRNDIPREQWGVLEISKNPKNNIEEIKKESLILKAALLSKADVLGRESFLTQFRKSGKLFENGVNVLDRVKGEYGIVQSKDDLNKWGDLSSEKRREKINERISQISKNYLDYMAEKKETVVSEFETKSDKIIQDAMKICVQSKVDLKNKMENSIYNIEFMKVEAEKVQNKKLDEIIGAIKESLRDKSKENEKKIKIYGTNITIKLKTKTKLKGKTDKTKDNL